MPGFRQSKGPVMRICVLGAGSVGSYLAACLARGGDEVSLGTVSPERAIGRRLHCR